MAWDFDHAIVTFGRYIENELDACKTKEEREARFSELFGMKFEPKPLSISKLMARGGVRVKS